MGVRTSTRGHMKTIRGQEIINRIGKQKNAFLLHQIRIIFSNFPLILKVIHIIKKTNHCLVELVTAGSSIRLVMKP